MGVADRALGQGVHITLPLVGAQILAELLAHALGAQPVDILLIEVIVQQKAGQLALACADGIALIVRVFAEEHIKHQRGILKTMQEQAVCHGEFIKIHHHRGVIVVLVRDIRLDLDLVHERFPLYLCPARGVFPTAPPAACPAGGFSALSRQSVSTMIARFPCLCKYFCAKRDRRTNAVQRSLCSKESLAQNRLSRS